jgi:succinate dehydrogenase/fumarate reductase flavoprotein subunit
MDKVQIHPTGLIDPKDATVLSKILGPEALRGCGGILVNKNGVRFVSELNRRMVVTRHIFDHGDTYGVLQGGREQKAALVILNEKVHYSRHMIISVIHYNY